MSTAAMATPLPAAAAAELRAEENLGKVISSPLRADLEMQQQQFRGSEYYVIKDPLSLTYFRLKLEEGFLIMLLDGKRNFREIHRLFHERFPQKDLSIGEIGVFIQQMNAAGLLNLSAERFVTMARADESVPTSWLMVWGKVLSGFLFMRFPLLDPSPWLGKLTHALRFIWTRWFIGLCATFIVWSVFWLVVNRDAFTQNTINFFSPDNLILVWATLIFVKTLHEFGHATTCRFFGGEVHEMGVCLMCFTPCGYVDASDAWMMRKKAHKLYTTGAGVFTEFVIAGITAHLWLYLPPGLGKSLAFNAMIIASVNTVFFNANPLMKFDGYYIVSDFFEIPNLRTKAMMYCSYHVQRWLLGYRNLTQERYLQEEVNNRVFIVYSVLAYFYMMTVIYSLSQVFAKFLSPYGLYDFGLAIGVFVEGSFLMFPVVKVLLDAFSTARKHTVREENVWGRIARWLIPLVVGLVVVFSLPSHYMVTQQAVLVAVRSERAGVEVGGVVEKVHVHTGQWIEAGQPLLTLRNSDVTTQAQIADLWFEATKLRLTSLQVSGSLRSTSLAPEAALSLEGAATARERAQRAVGQLEIRAPAAGFVVSPDIDRLAGQYLPPGFSGLRVADLRQYKLLIPLTEAQAEMVEIGSPVNGYTRASAIAVESQIGVLPSKRDGWHDYEPAMLTVFGGPAPLENGSNAERTTPSFGLYIAEADVAHPPLGAMEGLRVKVTVTGRNATYGQRVSRWIMDLWQSHSGR